MVSFMPRSGEITTTTPTAMPRTTPTITPVATPFQMLVVSLVAAAVIAPAQTARIKLAAGFETTIASSRRAKPAPKVTELAPIARMMLKEGIKGLRAAGPRRGVVVVVEGVGVA